MSMQRLRFNLRVARSEADLLAVLGACLPAIRTVSPEVMPGPHPGYAATPPAPGADAPAG